MTSSPIHRCGFRCQFLGDDLVPEELWDIAISILEKIGITESLYTLNRGLGRRRKFRDGQTPMTPEAIRKEIAADDKKSFSVHGEMLRVQSILYYSTPLDGGIQRFSVAIDPPGGHPPDWSIFAEAVCTYEQAVIAHPFDQIYRPWQSCLDPSEYERRFGSTEGLSIIESVQDPYTYRTIDTSKNPGRDTHNGLLPQIVASELWLGPMFWGLAPCTKEEVLAADFLLEVRDTPDFLYLKSWPRLFTRPDGEQGRVQQKLWRLLFHEDCEWPPGSGGISDIPVGGPPELMPDNPPAS